MQHIYSLLEMFRSKNEIWTPPLTDRSIETQIAYLGEDYIQQVMQSKGMNLEIGPSRSLNLLNYFLRNNCNFVSMGISASEELEPENPQLLPHYLQCDIRETKLQPAIYDNILSCCAVPVHIPKHDYSSFFENALTALKQDGLLISVPLFANTFEDITQSLILLQDKFKFEYTLQELPKNLSNELIASFFQKYDFSNPRVRQTYTIVHGFKLPYPVYRLVLKKVQF